MERKIEIVSMELIRPTSPTPDHLKCFGFSYLDQMAIPVFAPLALFYPPPPSHSTGSDESYSYEEARAANSSRLLLLKKSLSETLARFYPFAGRIKGYLIECNDDGVPFYEAFAHNYQFEDIHRNFDVTKHFLPSVEGSSVLHYSCIPLLVQVTFFKCGGMAIGMCAFHKVADGATLCTLANAWAITTRDSADCVLLPEFVATAKFLPPPIPYVLNAPKFQFDFTKFFYNEQYVTKLFAFNASTIASLKAKAMSDDVHVPTRVEVVSAVIWKSAMAASGTETRSSKLAHQVNIRKRFVPPLPNHCVGNAIAIATACKGDKDGSDLSTLVTCIRKSLSELSSKYVDKRNREEAILAIPHDFLELTEAHFRGEIAMQISSVCGYQFYDVDFGWGKPSWFSLIQMATRNQVLLMDSRDSGGIDAWICLKNKDVMSVFEHELELLAFGSAK
ncbi:PREDICTED: vinorine synthase-like [Nicotiana attenuata]|uniref:Bahd acyltransferase n=1 Tax=Nicotiana attenuata TaxID=49451 RepID=A0A314L242_NICAT|nr:PREDICTED: vinorine synthase-like [Nicotiana attenuata]OIT35572.1 bahd acyltransferase [Nicotiana attenuata]